MGLTLVIGPAHSGKIDRLLGAYLEQTDADPWLLVPNRGDVERLERELLARCPSLLAGRVATFDDLFEAVAAGLPDRPRLIGRAERSVLVARAVTRVTLRSLAASSRSSGFSDALAVALGELEGGLIETASLDGDLGTLWRAYRAELDAAGVVDRPLLRRAAVERLADDFSAWDTAPVLAYGFEDFTATEWRGLELLAARSQVTVTLPYEAGRAAFASLEGTASDLARLAGPEVEALTPASASHLPPALAYVERSLFVEAETAAPPLDGALRLLEGAGSRGTIELVADEIASSLRDGVSADRIGVVCDSVERWRVPLETAFGALEIPFVVEEPRALGRTPFGAATLALLRFAWAGGGRADLFRFLRSPYSGLQRASVDFVEGRLRGRAVHEPERVESESERLRGEAIPFVAGLRGPGTPLDRATAAIRGLVTAAYGTDDPRAEEVVAEDLLAAEAALRVLGELAGLEEVSAEEILSALERATVRAAAVGQRGRVAVLDYPRARTRRFDVIVLVGLEEGAFPRRTVGSPVLDDELRGSLGGRLDRPDPVSRDRYLFYTACTRPYRRLVLAREAATDDGVPREPSPFWTEVLGLFEPDEIGRATRRRSLSATTWRIEQAPSERERLRALARLASHDVDEARALADANGWSRRLQRATGAWGRATQLGETTTRWLSQRTSFSVTELERFADCSSAWLMERVVDPKTIDAEPDALLRGSLAHTALNRFSQAVPKELGVDRVADAPLEDALALMRRCVADALESGVRLELTDVQFAELRETLLRDLEGFVGDEFGTKLALVPRRFELAFGSERAAPELQRGLAIGDGLTVSGKIDRVDVDPFSARGIVQDYKSGRAPSAAEIDRELRLQIPLYLLVLRDLAGIEPIGGLYRSLSRRRDQRGILRSSAADDLPGFTSTDYLDEERFWEQVETARGRALEYAGRIRTGDVRHDPKDGCPSWCDLWPMCRVERS